MQKKNRFLWPNPIGSKFDENGQGGFLRLTLLVLVFFGFIFYITSNNSIGKFINARMAYSPQDSVPLFIKERCPGIVTDFPGTVILGRPTMNEITFNILSSESGEAYIDSQSEDTVGYITLSDVFTVQAGVPISITLSGLLPNSRYLYTIVRASPTGLFCTPGNSFQTQRSSGSSFKFSIIADSHLGTVHHCDPVRYSQTLRNIHTSNSDFVISLGDDFRASMLKAPVTLSSVYQLYQNQRAFFSIFAADAALFNIAGNHELQSGWLLDETEDNIPLWAIKSRLAHFPNPRPNYFYAGSSTLYDKVPQGLLENFYSWKWGDALFIALDNYLYSQDEQGWDVSLGFEQYQWLKDILMLPVGQKASFKFVFHHHLCGSARGGIEWSDYFEWGGYTPKTKTNPVKTWDFESLRPGWGNQPIHQILVSNGVDAVFQGHDHLFTKQDHPDGIVYLTVPFPGFDPNVFWGGEYDNSMNFHSGTILSPSGHISVEVTPTVATISYIMSRIPEDLPSSGANGQSAYTFSLPRKENLYTAYQV